MQEIRRPSIFVPMYMVNADEDVLDKYFEANGVDAVRTEGDIVTHYNQAWPLRKVIVRNVDTVDAAALISDAYYNMFVKAMRVPVLPQALVSAGSPYSGYNFDEAPYSLCDRSIVIDGKTEDGIYFIKHQNDTETFAEIKTTKDAEQMDGSIVEAGEYIDVWYEYLPEEVLDGTAEEGSIPLILAKPRRRRRRARVRGRVRPARAGRQRAHCYCRSRSSAHRRSSRPGSDGCGQAYAGNLSGAGCFPRVRHRLLHGRRRQLHRRLL